VGIPTEVGGYNPYLAGGAAALAGGATLGSGLANAGKGNPALLAPLPPRDAATAALKSTTTKKPMSAKEREAMGVGVGYAKGGEGC